MKRCLKCGEYYDESFFHQNVGDTRITQKRATCIGCEQQRRDDAKNSPLKRAKKKAHASIRNHAKKLGCSKDKLRDKYGWDADRMAKDILHAYNNGCCYCHTPFKDMGDMSNVTIDIFDVDAPPYYETNVRYCCPTCNKEKQRTPPDEWGLRLQMWKRWEKRQQELRNNPWAGTLLEGLDDV